jgi:hypothetical protein
VIDGERDKGKKGDSSKVAAPLQKIRLKQNAEENLREERGDQTKMAVRGENVGSGENEIGALKAI